MDNKKVGEYWDENAENWTKLSRMGYDRCRDLINSPAFFRMLPDIAGLKGLDIGCGEGYNTRIAAKKRAKLTAIDISKVFITHAKESEQKEPLGINYQVANAIRLPFPENNFDFAMATMSIMDVAENEMAITEAYRVIKPAGFFQFSISHPCFSTSNWEWEENEEGRRTGMIIRDYFKKLDGEVEEWIFGAAPEKIVKNMKNFRIPRFTRTISEWLNLLIKQGFVLEEFCEPYPDDEILKRYPDEYTSRIFPYFFIIRCRKPKES